MGTFGFLDSTGMGWEALTIAPQIPTITTAKPNRSLRLLVDLMNLGPSVNVTAVPSARRWILQFSHDVIRKQILF